MGTLGIFLRALHCSRAGKIPQNEAWRVSQNVLASRVLPCAEQQRDRLPSRRRVATFPPTRVNKTCSKSLQNSAQRRTAADEGSTRSTQPDRRLDLAQVVESSGTEAEQIVLRDFELHENFVSEREASCLLDEVEDYLEDLEYEYDHWDNAIHGYRETEKSRWSQESNAVLQRIRQTAFPAGEQQLSLVHVLDLAKDGYIKPHVDSVKFCGSTIAGLSLLSTSIMRLAKEDDPECWVHLVLRPRSLYVMKGRARYEFTHEILKDSESVFRGQKLARDRRISIMCRNVPPPS